MTPITRTELRDILMGIENPTFISFISLTPVEMNKYLNYWLVDGNGKKTKNPNPTPNPYFEMGIQNLSRKYKIVTGFDYEKSVNRRLEKEGKESDFEVSDNWFTVLSKGLVTDTKTGTKHYIRYQHQKDSTIEQEYTFQGNNIEKQLFESYMKSKSNYENQGLDNPLMFQVCNLDNLLSISINKEQYQLID